MNKISVYTRHLGILPAFAAVLCLGFAGNSVVWAEEAEGESSTEEAETPPATGLNRIMDGTNLETFESSLAVVKSEISEKEFKTLMNALGYLRVYDISAKRNKEKVYQNLDGKTPAEIMGSVRWRTGNDG